MADNKKRKERITSPEKLDVYLQVTKPSMWIVIGAVFAIVIAFIVWGSITTVDAEVNGYGSVTDGTVFCVVDETTARVVEEGQTLWVGKYKTQVTSVTEEGSDSHIEAKLDIADGIYPTRLIIDNISPISYLIN